MNIYPVVDHPVYPDHLVAEVTRTEGSCEIRKRYRIYPGVAALVMDLFLKKNSGDREMEGNLVDEYLTLPGRHWNFTAVEFLDRTDQNNNLVRTIDIKGFTKTAHLKGNLLIARKEETGERIFVLKESGRIREEFVIRELQEGARLGITHFQLDDGWQMGLSKNSVSSGGKLWELWAAGELDIDLGLWFHPSNEGSYENWEQDVSVLLDLYEGFGIRTFKIDGMELPDKNADLRMRKIFD